MNLLHSEAQVLVTNLLDQAMQKWPNTLMPHPEVRFDLKGLTGGMAHRRGRYIRLNADLLESEYDHMFSQTIPHEVAHVVAYAVYGNNGYRIRPHGREWASVMRLFGARPDRCHNMESAVASRKVRRHDYLCACGPVQLTSVRHNRVKKGVRYRCGKCATVIMPAS